MSTMSTTIPSSPPNKTSKTSFFRLHRWTHPSKKNKQDDPPADSDNDSSMKPEFTTSKKNPPMFDRDRVPEYVFVILIEIFIVLTAALGCLFLVAGPSNTFPVAPAVMWVANLFTWIGALILCYFTSCVLNRTQPTQPVSIIDTTTQEQTQPPWKKILTGFVHFLQLLCTQTVKFDNKAETVQVWFDLIGACWEAFFKLSTAYNVQFLLSAILVTFLTEDVDDNASNDPAIILFNGNHIDPYGYGITRIIAVVTIIFVCVFLVLMLIVHSYMQKYVHQASISFWIFFAPLFFQTQYIQYYNDKRFNSSEPCTYGVLDVPSCDVEELRFAMGLIVIWWLSMFLDQIVSKQLEVFVIQKPNPTVSFDSKFAINALLTMTHISAIPILLYVAISSWGWLQQPRFYFVNLLIVLFLFLSRVRDRLLLATQETTNLQESPGANSQMQKQPLFPQTPKAQQYGTAQPRFFFRRPNAVFKRD